MSLDMKIYKDLTTVEPKVMFGMSWRQLASSALLLPVAGGMWALFYLVLGWPDVGLYVVFVACVPVAAWGWWRPHRLKPERWIVYVLRGRLGTHTFLFDGRVFPREPSRPSIDERRMR